VKTAEETRILAAEVKREKSVYHVPLHPALPKVSLAAQASPDGGQRRTLAQSLAFISGPAAAARRHARVGPHWNCGCCLGSC